MTYTAPMRPKYLDIDVDDFLKKIMVSEKFDEITDRIADKAVQKFQKLQDVGSTPVLETKLKDAAYRVSESEIKDQNDIDEEEKNISEVTEKYKQPSEKHLIGKIDPEAFLKKDNPFKDVSLKYKHFKQRLPTTVSKEKTLTDLEDTPKGMRTETTRSVEVQSPINRARERSSNFEGTTKHVTKKRVKKHRLKNTVKTTLTTKRHDSGISIEMNEGVGKKVSKPSKYSEEHALLQKNAKFEEKTDSVKTTNEDYSTYVENKEENEKVESKEYLQLPIPDEKKHNNVKKHKITRNTKTKAVVDKNKSVEKEIENKVKQKKKDTKGKSVVPVEKSGFYHRTGTVEVRREGNKLFAQQRDPDYEDYRQELAIIQKKLKKID